jgi:hypothetical protein
MRWGKEWYYNHSRRFQEADRTTWRDAVVSLCRILRSSFQMVVALHKYIGASIFLYSIDVLMNENMNVWCERDCIRRASA